MCKTCENIDAARAGLGEPNNSAIINAANELKEYLCTETYQITLTRPQRREVKYYTAKVYRARIVFCILMPLFIVYDVVLSKSITSVPTGVFWASFLIGVMGGIMIYELYRALLPGKRT